MNFTKQFFILIALLSSFSIFLQFSGYTGIQLKKNLGSQKFWQNKTFTKKKYDIVLCGDSRVYRGLSPEHFEKNLSDLTVLNFGYSSTIYDSFYLKKAKEKLSPNGKRIYVLGITAHSFVNKENGALLHYLQKGNKSSLEDSVNSLIQQIFPSITIRQLSKVIRGRASELMGNYHQEFFTNGWVKSDRIGTENLALDSYKLTFTKHKVDKSKIESLISFIKSEKSNGALFYALRLPTSKEINELEDKSSGLDLEKLIAELKNNGVHWISVNNDDYRSYDGSHIDGKSAINLSVLVSKKIKKTLGL